MLPTNSETPTAVTATLKVLNDVTIALDSKQCWAAIFDLAKAFDTVEHFVLVGWLRSIDASEESLTWFASYLKRVQCLSHCLSPMQYPKAQS
jgi:hypothetical protein